MTVDVDIEPITAQRFIYLEGSSFDVSSKPFYN